MNHEIPFLNLAEQISRERPEIEAVLDRVLQSGQMILGSELAAFEGEFAAWNQTAHAVGVSSGCDAISLLLKAVGIGTGHEVVVPGFTCPATWMGVRQAGARPVPARVNPATGLLDPKSIKDLCTSSTKAVLAVHLYGAPCEMADLERVCRDCGLWLFVDAAQSTGIEIGGSRSPALGDGAAFSFYPTKNLAALDDAGAVVTPHGQIAAAVASLRNYGKDIAGLHQSCGINARMGELQAAILRMRLPKVAKWNQRRKDLATLYLNQLAGLAGIDLPAADPESVWHLFVVRVASPRSRDQIATALQQHGIGTAVHYREAFSTCPAMGALHDALPCAETLASSVLSLPLHPWLGENDVLRICECLKSIFKEPIPPQHRIEPPDGPITASAPVC